MSVLGMGAVAVVCTTCLGACKVDPGGNITAPSNVDFTLDLTNSAYATLRSVGGYAYNGGIIVAHTPSGFVAVSAACTHQGASVVYQGGQFYCPAHGSVFNTTGGVVQGPAGSSLGSYKTTLTGNSLRVYS